jgi:hypothetical protein
MEGELLFENKNAPVIKAPASITCSSKYDGSVGADGVDEITELLTLTAEELVSATPLTGASLACTKGAGDEFCENGSKVWAVHLPWLTLLELWESGGASGFVDLSLPTTNGNPGWYVECKGIVTLSEECTASELVAEQKNVTGGVESNFSEGFTLLMESKLGLCSGNGEETGTVSGGGSITSLPGGGSLTASSTVVFLLAEWLRNGASISETLLALLEGEGLFENKNIPIAKRPGGITCSWKYDGSVGTDGAGEINELLTLATEELVNLSPLSGIFLGCVKGVGDEVCENGSRIWAVHLSWLSLLVLWEVGGVSGFADLILPATSGNPGWYIECNSIVTLSEECTTPEIVAEQVNMIGGVESRFSDAFTLLMEAQLWLCSGNGEETGSLEASNNFTSLPEGAALTVSSE